MQQSRDVARRLKSKIRNPKSKIGLLLRPRRRCRCPGGLLEAVRPAELLAEPLHAAGGVDELLLAGEERVALATDVDRDLGQRAAGRERVAARAVGGAGLITRVNLGFHG